MTSVAHAEVSQQHKLTSMINKGAVRKVSLNQITILCNSQVVRKYLLGAWCIHSQMPLKLLLYGYISWWYVLPGVVAAMREIPSKTFFLSLALTETLILSRQNK